MARRIRIPPDRNKYS